jgi:hypothetical protein
MKKYLSLVFIFLSFSQLYPKGRERYSQTFMFTRPLHTNFFAEQQLWHNFIYSKKGDGLGTLQVCPMFSYSISRDKVERYFLMEDKNILSVKSDRTALKDIWGGWLRLQGAYQDSVNPNPDFSGNMTMDPSQWQFGCTVEYNQDLKKFIKWDFFKNFWFAALIPIVYTNNNLNLAQSSVENAASSGIRDIIEAFRPNDWKNAKIRGSRDFAGIPEIQLKLGTEFLDRKDAQVSLYSHILIPTCHKPHADYMFNAVAGHGRHFGLGSGVNFQIPLNSEYVDYLFAIFLNVEQVYLFENNQHRTIDLRGKPYSRYLMFNHKDSVIQAAVPGVNTEIPGVNILTPEFKCSPKNMVDLSVGVRFGRPNKFEGEIGYDLWAHGDEELRLKDKWDASYGIAGSSDDGTIPFAAGKTASLSTISKQKGTDTTIGGYNDGDDFNVIHEKDLDIKSGAIREALTHRIHMGLGYGHKGSKTGIFFGMGAFVEWPHQNTALSMWGMWFKGGATF